MIVVRPIHTFEKKGNSCVVCFGKSSQPTKQIQPAQEIVYPEKKDNDIKDLIIKRGLHSLGNKK